MYVLREEGRQLKFESRLSSYKAYWSASKTQPAEPTGQPRISQGGSQRQLNTLYTRADQRS